MPEDTPKHVLLTSLGYAPPHDHALDLMAKHGLSNRDKQRINATKKGAVQALLQEHLFRACTRGDCQVDARRAAGNRLVVAAVSSRHCEICEGSPLVNAARRMKEACERVGWRRLCIVGGSPSAHQQLKELFPESPELRLIDGTAARNKTDARADIQWADRIVILGSSQLNHRISLLYSDQPHCTTCEKRGIGGLCEHVIESASRARTRPGGR